MTKQKNAAKHRKNAERAEAPRKFPYPHLPIGEKQATVTAWLLLTVTPLISFTLVEYLNYNNPWTEFTPIQIILNLVWYYLGEVFFYWIRGRKVAAAKWALCFAWVLGMANHYLISFRGRTLFPGDFLSLGTAANVAANYDYIPNEMQVATLVVMLAALLLMNMMPKEARHTFSWKLFVPVTGAAALYIGLFFGTGMVERLGIEPSMWTTRGNGLTLNFSVCLKYMKVEKPQDYSDEAVAAIAADSGVELPDGGIAPVNVIVVMNESLSDFSQLPGVETNQDAMPFYHSLTENTIKGYAYASIFGGTTANSEYEFLTGNTTAFLPAGTVPYQMYVGAGDPTLVGQMKNEGYRCVAAHPYRSSGWSRPTVYDYFGFDEVYFERDFTDAVYMRGGRNVGYVTDRSNYEFVTGLFEEKTAGEGLFLFNVTMQNHSAYNMSWEGLDRTVWLTGAMADKYPTVDQYLSLVYQSDLALEYLVDYFAQVEEPTLIVMFGDHQPQVATNFYTRVLGSNPATALAQKKQMVPFLIWANYDIPEQDGVELSLNYLSTLMMRQTSLPLTGYQQFLQALYTAAPIINTVGIRDSEGRWYGEHEEIPPTLSEALEEYRILTYANVFDKAARPDGFFGSGATDDK